MDPALLWIPLVTKEKRGTTLPWLISQPSCRAACRRPRELAAGDTHLPEHPRCIPVASSGPSALGIRLTGDEATRSPRARGQHGRASTEAATSSSATAPRLGPQQQMRCSRCQRWYLDPGIQIQLRGEP